MPKKIKIPNLCAPWSGSSYNEMPITYLKYPQNKVSIRGSTTPFDFEALGLVFVFPCFMIGIHQYFFFDRKQQRNILIEIRSTKE